MIPFHWTHFHIIIGTLTLLQLAFHSYHCASQDNSNGAQFISAANDQLRTMFPYISKQIMEHFFPLDILKTSTLTKSPDPFTIASLVSGSITIPLYEVFTNPSYSYSQRTSVSEIVSGLIRQLSDVQLEKVWYTFALVAEKQQLISDEYFTFLFLQIFDNSEKFNQENLKECTEKCGQSSTLHYYQYLILLKGSEKDIENITFGNCDEDEIFTFKLDQLQIPSERDNLSIDSPVQHAIQIICSIFDKTSEMKGERAEIVTMKFAEFIKELQDRNAFSCTIEESQYTEILKYFKTIVRLPTSTNENETKHFLLKIRNLSIHWNSLNTDPHDSILKVYEVPTLYNVSISDLKTCAFNFLKKSTVDFYFKITPKDLDGCSADFKSWIGETEKTYEFQKAIQSVWSIENIRNVKFDEKDSVLYLWTLVLEKMIKLLNGIHFDIKKAPLFPTKQSPESKPVIPSAIPPVTPPIIPSAVPPATPPIVKPETHPAASPVTPPITAPDIPSHNQPVKVKKNEKKNNAFVYIYVRVIVCAASLVIIIISVAALVRIVVKTYLNQIEKDMMYQLYLEARGLAATVTYR